MDVLQTSYQFGSIGKRYLKASREKPAERTRGDLSAEQRIEYTNAVLCLQSKPGNTPSELAPGAKTRYDDWVATHINSTFFIHDTVCHRTHA